ncbi:DUF1648 domain-containing protein [Ichthyenterobacterium sp. W332]|uniref:DUF1648 domain-containing protein n=1 Tax=Microcosmobacter mediterraneus TaxID=3075607 RepID=A0ABU2YQD2_9FLAO|nr:DUF1648 domain-containing protein [Ichthyenterobacterium sp. W332]MDT0559273.1 DUF1648 domain-containing protein [Ichthyenterobacterium sp. W332]
MSKRPRIQIPLETFDYVIELLSLTLLIITWYFVISSYAELPDSIPTRFGIKGEPTEFNSKLILWVLPGLATFIYGLMLVLTKFPHTHNYMVNITENNALKNYRFSIRVLRIVNFLCVLLFLYLTYHIVESAKGASLSLGRMFMPIVIGSSIILPIVLVIYQKKLNKS